MEPVIVKLQQRGASLAVVLPRPMLHALQWRRGLHIEASLRGDVLELAAVHYRDRGPEGTFEPGLRVDPSVKSL